MRTLGCVAALVLAGCQCGTTPPSVCEQECAATVPATECVAGSVRTYAVDPDCAGGCQYLHSDRKCDFGCADGLCLPAGSVGGGSGGSGGGVAGGAGGAGGDAGVDPCIGLSCNAPPVSACANAQQLKVFDAPGTCGNGACQYASHLETCANGCANDACTGSPCQGVSCNAPPPNSCLDASTLTVYAAAGTCAGGACTYAPSQTTCPFGCANGGCTNDPCLGKTCNQPPAAFCASATTRRSFSAAGTCAGGSCTYASADATCPFGCANGACLPNPCTGITCTAPPAATCVNGAARTYSAAGTCSAGSCSYGFADVPCANGCAGGLCNGPTCNGVTCNTPPADVCTSASRLKAYARLGTCVSSACSYQSTNIDCSQGCFNGACIAGSWTVEASPLPTALLRQSLAFDPSGTPHVAGCTAGGDLIYRSSNDSGWFDETVDPALGAMCFASIAVDAQGPAIAYLDSTNGDLRFARRVNGAWSLKELALTVGYVGYGASLTFDPANGQAVVGYYDASQQQLRVARRTAANTWTTELAGAVTLSAGASASPAISIRFDAQGALHLVAGVLPNSTSVQPVVWAKKDAAGAWTNEALGPYGFVARSAIGVGPNGDVRILWRYTDPRLRTRSTVASIDEAVRGMGGTPGLGAPLDGARTPEVILAGLEGNGQLNTSIATQVNGFWTSKALPLAPSLIGILHDMKLAPDGRTRGITSVGLLASPALCQPQCSGRTCGDDGCGGTCGSCSATQGCSPMGTCGAWAGETLRGVQTVNAAASLAFDGSGGLHAMVGTGTSQYFDHSYFRRTASGWSAPEPVASGLVSGRESFALSGSGVPLVAYMDSEMGLRARAVPWSKDVAATDYGTRPNLLVDASGAKKLVRAKLPSNLTWELEVWTQAGPSGWAKETIVTGTSGQVNAISSALDAAGKLHVVFEEHASGPGGATKLRYATNASGAFVVEPVHTNALSSYAFFQMRVTPAGVPHVVLYPWLDGSYAVRGATGWTVEALPTTLKLDYQGNAYVPRFALDGQGIANLVVPHPAVPWRLDHAVRTGAGAWSISVVPTYALNNSQNLPIEFQFDPAGKAHLLLWDDTVLRHVFKP